MLTSMSSVRSVGARRGVYVSRGRWEIHEAALQNNGSLQRGLGRSPDAGTDASHAQLSIIWELSLNCSRVSAGTQVFRLRDWKRRRP